MENVKVEKPVINKNKSQINATVPPWIKKRCIYLANQHEDFTTVSDIVTVALVEFFKAYDIMKKEMKQSEEDRLKELIRSVIQEVNEESGMNNEL